MYKVIVRAFGGVEQLDIVDLPDPIPAAGEVVVGLTSIGMNNAELMARRGEYRLISGNPPFTPGLEGGGVIVAVGSRVSDRNPGQRVILTLDAPASKGQGQGTYQSHYVVRADQTVPAPAGVPNELLGTLWLPYLTAWGCLVWQQALQPGQTVLIPGASSSVAIAAAQVVKHHGGIAVGTTTSADKLAKLQAMPEAPYDHLILTRDTDWYRAAKKLTSGKGFNVIFDPVAAGDFLNTEIRLLAHGGTLWIYGLLGKPDVVNVHPLIRKMASLRGWVLNQLSGSGVEQAAYEHVLQRVTDGTYQMPVAAQFSLREVRQAQAVMEQGKHIGKLILVP
ncbi:zinc-binding dehydrogenase [Pseudanabaena sp. FACHB-2040]|uniref:zinc-binding dehydrogenase n=1 Tax=Pseudanabaena sp. FACHB-2040 TaxID=2692859 RepID=UPI00168485F1|nr:zinc-binding dehydrogenase [Pseudanabaena sp. FACHB-2040]MBD2259231.1 zinc-binding dehydrogenase [Pseudanabaena sp. FACHB-2040]